MERQYVKDKHGHVGYLEGDGEQFHGLGYISSPVRRDELTLPSTEEIEEFESKEKERRLNEEKRHNREVKLLSKCGLKHDDFVRFRNVSESDGQLIVETRENGVNGRSVDALKNPNYHASHADSFDSTYEYYIFNTPNKQ